MSNNLEGMVIVERELFRALKILADRAGLGRLSDEDEQTCDLLWNQDLSGMVVAPFEPTLDMIVKGRTYENMIDPWKLAYQGMLSAAPKMEKNNE